MPDRMESAERRGLDMSEKYVVDSLGDKCPVPVVKAKKALDKAMPGDVIEVHVDNDIAVQNLRKLASNMQLCRQTAGGKAFCSGNYSRRSRRRS